MCQGTSQWRRKNQEMPQAITAMASGHTFFWAITIIAAMTRMRRNMTPLTGSANGKFIKKFTPEMVGLCWGNVFSRKLGVAYLNPVIDKAGLHYSAPGEDHADPDGPE